MVLEVDHAHYYVHPGVDFQKEKAVKKEIAFFDFDGTITTKDTLLEFIRFCKGTFRFWLGMVINLPFVVAYKLQLISNQSAKEKVLSYFFRNTPLAIFEQCCEGFTKNALPGLLRTRALEEINRLQQSGIRVVIVSASPENWIRAWADSIKVDLIASRLEIKNHMITGKIMGKNCHGDEKVNRIKEAYDLSAYKIVAAYGDTRGDKPMLELASKAYYKPFGN